MISPYKGTFRVSQAYRNPRPGRGEHQGFDLVGISDKTIYCPVYGIVEYAGWESASNHKQGFGQYVRIRIGSTIYRMYFGHLSEVFVRAGQVVTPGAMLGIEGSTGHSTGSHCHWEIRKGTDRNSYVSVANYSAIPNRASGAPYRSDWDAALLGPKTLRRGPRCGAPDILYVSLLQHCLGIAPDGIFGADTERAVRSYQAAHNLTADGLAGRRTKASLLG